MGALIQSYTVVDNAYSLGFGSGPTFVDEVGTSIQAAATFALGGVEVILTKTGSPTGSIYAAIYAHSGTFGTSSIPTGSPLATSNTLTVDTATLISTRYKFNFGGNIVLTSGTNYCLSIVGNFTFANSSNCINVGYDVTGAVGAGNAYWKQGGTYAAFNTDDMAYWMYSGDASFKQNNLRPKAFAPGLAR